MRALFKKSPVHTLTPHIQIFKVSCNVIHIFMFGFPRRSRKDFEGLYYGNSLAFGPGFDEENQYHSPDTVTSGLRESNSKPGRYRGTVLTIRPRLSCSLCSISCELYHVNAFADGLQRDLTVEMHSSLS
jgi:hypothetical protein